MGLIAQTKRVKSIIGKHCLRRVKSRGRDTEENDLRRLLAVISTTLESAGWFPVSLHLLPGLQSSDVGGSPEAIWNML